MSSSVLEPKETQTLTFQEVKFENLWRFSAKRLINYENRCMDIFSLAAAAACKPRRYGSHLTLLFMQINTNGHDTFR